MTRKIDATETPVGEGSGKPERLRQREARLNDSEGQLRALVRGLPDIVLRFDREGRHCFASDNVVDVTGIPAAAFIGRTHRELGFAEPMCSFWEAAIRRVFESGNPFETEFVFDGPKGEIDFNWRLVPEKDADGRVASVFSISRDITAHRKIEQDYRTLFREMLEGFALHEIICDDSGLPVDYRFLAVNPAFERMTGLRAADILGKTVVEVLPETEPQWIETFGAVALTGRPAFFQNHSKVVGKSFEVTAFRPAPGQFACIFSDITERVRATEALRESEEKFRLTYHASPDSVNINRLRDGLYIDINEGFTQLTGFTREDAIGRTSSEINIWHDPADRRELVRGLLENGYTENLEARFRKKDGSLTTALMSARVIDLKGEPHIISITRDISDRKAAEAERELLLAAIEQAAEVIVITDAGGAIQYANPAFEKISGYSREEVRGQNPRILNSGKHDSAFYRGLWQTISSGGIWKGRLINRKKDGTLYTEEASISPVIDAAGKVLNYVAVKKDITHEISITEQLHQAQKMESIGTLAGGIAHDFNNILFPIVGMSEMLMEDFPEGGPEHRSAQMILTSAKRGSDLVKQILAFSRQTERAVLPVKIQKILGEAIQLCRSSIPSYIGIAEDIHPRCGHVMADPTQVHQVAMNLITNAFHAVEPAGGNISIALAERALTEADPVGGTLRPGRYAVLSVTDDGCGIEPANMEKIFDPYFTTKAKGKGTGLGLAVVYGIVREHGGDIRVRSTVGKGTTVTVFWPLIGAGAETDGVDPGQALPGGDEHILLVDDEKPVVQIVARSLERLGYRVSARDSSVAALAAFREAPTAFDLVITDLTMPVMTGDQLSRAIAAIRPDIPIVICTGFSERLDAAKAEALGFRGFLMKPVIRSEMARMVRAVLDAAKVSPPG